MLGRLFGGSGAGAGRAQAGVGGRSATPGDPDTAALRRIVAQLDSLPAAQRKFIAGFAYILGRVANADLVVSPEEVRLMEKTVMEVGELPEAEAVLVIQIALNHEALYGGTDNYLITREVSRTASRAELEKLLRCCFAVGAADQVINAEESAELDEIGRELGFNDAEIRVYRAEFHDSFGSVRQVRRALPTDSAGADVPEANAGEAPAR